MRPNMAVPHAPTVIRCMSEVKPVPGLATVNVRLQVTLGDTEALTTTMAPLPGPPVVTTNVPTAVLDAV